MIPVLDPSQYASHLSDDALVIFLFHGIISRQRYQIRNYTRKHLESGYFDRILTALRASGTPVTMDQVVEAAQTGSALPPRAFAISFDDGFRNNLTIAAPILERHQVPAIFYLTTGFMGSDGRTWIDRVEAAVEDRHTATLRLPWGVRHYNGIFEARQVLDELRLVVKADRSLDPDRVADDILSQLDMDNSPWDAELDDKLSWSDVRQMAANPLFLLGGHSHTHAILSFLSPAALEEEIATTLRLLRQEAGIGSRHFSYPEGLPHCYSDAVISTLRRHGVVCCPTAENGNNPRGADLFRLKRVMVT